MKKFYSNNKYIDLSNGKVKDVFFNLGFRRIPGTLKPYYLDLNGGYVCRVISPNKLMIMKDNASESRYGYVKLKMMDGSYKSCRVNRLIGDFIPNPNKKPIVHHTTGYKNRNGIFELAWADYSENTKAYYEMKLNESEE